MGNYNYISGGYGNLFIVGDPDQAIYEWRGAIPDNFINFPAETDIVLNQNYRSTPNILNVANSIIANNENRIPKDLFTVRPADRIVVHYHGKSELEECQWIAKQIKEISKNNIPYSSFAILYRASYLSRNIEQELMRSQIKYVIWGGIRFFERKEIKDCLAYLRLIANKNDDLSFKRIINVPARKFGKTSQNKLQEIADSEKCSLYEALVKHKDDERLENIEELKRSIQDYENANVESEFLSLESYLQEVALYTNADYKEDGENVRLMTIHQAKGLEFPYVFVMGLSEGIFPNYRSIRANNKRAEEEERRLMYVAVTRAENALFLTESEGYNYVLRQDKFPSRYILEIKDGLLQVEGEIDDELMKNLLAGTRRQMENMDANISIATMEYEVGDKVTNKYFGIGTIIEKATDSSYKVEFSMGKRVVQTKYLQPCDDKAESETTNSMTVLKKRNSEPTIKLSVGDIVEHALLGKGKVTVLSGTGKDAIATVEFDKTGKIELMMSRVTSKVLKVLESESTPHDTRDLNNNNEEGLD